MANLTEAEKDVLRIARSVIRDQAMGYVRRELMVAPERICKLLTDLLGERYDFEHGKAERGETR